MGFIYQNKQKNNFCLSRINLDNHTKKIKSYFIKINIFKK